MGYVVTVPPHNRHPMPIGAKHTYQCCISAQKTNLIVLPEGLGPVSGQIFTALAGVPLV